MAPPTKRRKIETTAVEEITFDLTARQEYLTGFHKRKLQRAKQAQEAAEKRAKAERIEERKKLREGRRADLQRHVEEVNALLRPALLSEDSEAGEENSGSGEGWDGVSEAEVSPVDHEAEYIDEDKYTTVTVEAIDVSKEGLFKAEEARQKDNSSSDGENQPGADVVASEVASEKAGKRKWTKEKPRDKPDKPKKKRKKFRYENKAERKFTRFKEKTKNSKQAKARREG